MAGMREKTAAVVIIGNEILTGKTEDENAGFLISECTAWVLHCAALW